MFRLVPHIVFYNSNITHLLSHIRDKSFCHTFYFVSTLYFMEAFVTGLIESLEECQKNELHKGSRQNLNKFELD